jgi:hypothetical protein
MPTTPASSPSDTDILNQIESGNLDLRDIRRAPTGEWEYFHQADGPPANRWVRYPGLRDALTNLAANNTVLAQKKAAAAAQRAAAQAAAQQLAQARVNKIKQAQAAVQAAAKATPKPAPLGTRSSTPVPAPAPPAAPAAPATGAK